MPLTPDHLAEMTRTGALMANAVVTVVLWLVVLEVARGPIGARPR